MGNIAILIDLALKAMLQAQQYQLVVSKAIAEGRDVTDAELVAARTAAEAALDTLAKG